MANSSTQLASLVQRTNAVMQEAQGRIAAIFSELDEASPAEALHPASLADLNTMQRYETLVWERLAFAENAIERIDALLAEVQEQSDIINNDPDDAARSFKRVVDERLGELRSVYPQRVHLTQRVVLAAADTLAFMRSRFGSYHVQNESIDFDNSEDAEIYQAHIRKVQARAAQEGQFERDIQAADQRWLRSKGQVFNL